MDWTKWIGQNRLDENALDEKALDETWAHEKQLGQRNGIQCHIFSENSKVLDRYALNKCIIVMVWSIASNLMHPKY